MKLKLFAMLLSVVLVICVSTITETAQTVTKNIDETTTPLIDIDKAPINLTGWRETINGNKIPEAMSDTAAFSLLFRFIAGNQDVEAKKRIRSYVKQIGLGKCKMCSAEANKDRGSEQDLNALIDAADEFQRQVSVLDSQAVEIKSSNQPSSQATAQLKQLQLQKEALVAEIVASLFYKLTETGMNKVRRHVIERVKKNSILKAEQVSALLSNQAEQPSDQYEYTDSYPIEQSQPEPVTDPETGEQITPLPESNSPAQVVGVGVTESSYESDVYMVDTYTTITTPSGSVISQSPVVTDYTYARAETIADLDSETTEEGDYTVQSRHRYKHFSDGVEPVAGYEALKQPVRKKGNRSARITPNMCYGCGGYYFTTSFTFIRFGIREQVEAFGRDARYDNQCFRAFGEIAPYAYVALCPQNRYDRCRIQGGGCAPRRIAPYIAVYTNVFYIFGVRFCPFSRPVYTLERPMCKINV